MFNKQSKKEEVYSSTDLGDLLSSPVFYSVLVLASFLGLLSTFGFLNNPRKLKTAVDVINQKFFMSPNSNTVIYDRNEDYLFQKYAFKASIMNNAKVKQGKTYLAPIGNPYNILSKVTYFSNSSKQNRSENQRVAFDYDITSNEFWGDLDASTKNYLNDESDKFEDLQIGAPLSSEYLLEQGDEKYSLKLGLLRL